MRRLLDKFSAIALDSQFKRNMLSGSLLHGLNILVVMISYPIYIKYLGFELFSVWSLISVVIGFASLGDLGISRAVITFTANAKFENNFKEINRVFFSSLILTVVSTVIIAVIIWNFSSEIINILNVPIQYHEIAIVAVRFIGIAIGTYIIFDMLMGVVTGIGRLDVSNLMYLLLNIFKIVATVIFLSLGMSLLGMVYAILFANLFFIGLMLLLIILKFKIPIYKWVKPRKNNILSLLKFGSSIIGMQILNMISTPLIKIILSRSVGIESVGVFELAYKASYALRTFFQKGLFAIMPEIAKMHSSKISTNRRVYIKVKMLTTRLLKYILPLLIVFILLAPIWLKIWLNENYSISLLSVFWILQPGILLGLLALPAYYALMGTRNEVYCLYESLIRTILLLVLGGVFILTSLNDVYLYSFFSFSVVISNLFILISFHRKFHKSVL